MAGDGCLNLCLGLRIFLIIGILGRSFCFFCCLGLLCGSFCFCFSFGPGLFCCGFFCFWSLGLCFICRCAGLLSGVALGRCGFFRYGFCWRGFFRRCFNRRCLCRQRFLRTGYDLCLVISEHIVKCPYCYPLCPLYLFFAVFISDDAGGAADGIFPVVHIQEDHLLITGHHVHVVSVLWQSDKHTQVGIHTGAFYLGIYLVYLTFSEEQVLKLADLVSVGKVEGFCCHLCAALYCFFNRSYQIGTVDLEINLTSGRCVNGTQIRAYIGEDHSCRKQK